MAECDGQVFLGGLWGMGMGGGFMPDGGSNSIEICLIYDNFFRNGRKKNDRGLLSFIS